MTATTDILGSPSQVDDGLPVLIVKPSRGWVSLKLREVWVYRELLYFLTWRDIKVRYKQTALGAAWAIIQPFMTMVIFSLFFGNLAKVPSDGIPYPIFSYAALIPWTFFASGLTKSSNSLVGSASLIQKVYFPRLVVPISGVLTGLPDFALSFLVLIVMMLYYGLFPTLASIIWLPLLLILALITSLGVGLWLSALNVQYRDVGYITPFLTQIWLFATPIAYSSSLLREPWRTLYGINPMVGVVEGFRWALLSGSKMLNPVNNCAFQFCHFSQVTSSSHAPGPILLVSTGVALLLLITGAFYFRRMEKSFADVV